MAIEGSWATTPGWKREHFESELASERAVLLVLEDEEGVAGYRKVPPEAQITTIAVRRGKSGWGAGRRLLGGLLERAKAEGLSLATLEVSARNEPALRLYKAAGFKVVGRRAKFYNGASDAILMDLNLS